MTSQPREPAADWESDSHFRGTIVYQANDNSINGVREEQIAWTSPFKGPVDSITQPQVSRYQSRAIREVRLTKSAVPMEPPMAIS